MLSAKPLALISLAFALTGCVGAQATMLTPHRYPPVHQYEVRVFLNPEEVPETCERVALIHTQGDVDLTNERQMISAAKRRAGKAGANALLLNTIRDPSTGTRVAGAVFGLPTERKGQMLGLRCPAPATADSSTR